MIVTSYWRMQMKKEKNGWLSLRQCLQMLLAPAVIGAVLAVHLTLPNVYPDGYESYWYPLCLKASLVVYALCFAFACWFVKVRRKLLHLSWLLAALFLAVEIIDILTLKTGHFRLPFIPSPDKIISTIPDYYDRLVESFFASMKLLFTGIFCGVTLGVISGALMGWSQFCNYWFSPLLKIIGPVPAAAWLPIVMVLAPSGYVAGIILIFLAVWFPVTLNFSSGIRNTDKKLIETARVLGAGEGYIMRHIALPAALPSLFTGLFMGLSSSFGALIWAEMLGVKAGLGWYLSWAQAWGEYGRVFSTVLIFIVLFFIMIDVLFRIRDRVMKWQKGSVKW